MASCLHVTFFTKEFIDLKFNYFVKDLFESHICESASFSLKCYYDENFLFCFQLF